MGSLLDGLILATASVHVFLAPYTKVEESFNLHATHDVLMYGLGPSALPSYDHFVFSGAVPRSFIGSVLLAWISTPVLYAADYFGLLHSKFDLQLIVRLVLTTLNALVICLIRRAVSRRFGRGTSTLFAILSCTQFHLPFWMGRTLPNMFALIPVNVSSYLLLNLESNALRPSTLSVKRAISLLTFTAVVFRSEVALLLAAICLQSLVIGSISFGSLVKTGLVAGLSSIGLTVLVDSYFWSQWPLWPELYGLYFNVYQGKSAEWGVSPPHTYFTSHLPKLLLSSLPLAFLSLVLPSSPRNRTWTTLLPHILFVLGLSALGHKEWRFVVYVVPMFNVAAARSAHWLTTRRASTVFGRICRLVFFGLLAGNIAATYILTRSSMVNYPGGVALATFNDRYANQTNVHVHISNFAAQTGASLFLQTHAPPYPTFLPSLQPTTTSTSTTWTYSKTENLTLSALTDDRSITHLIAESPKAKVAKGWNVTGALYGFKGWRVDKSLVGDLKSGRVLEGEGGIGSVWERLVGALSMEEEEMLWILERAT